jgi:multisubunit Na+/H+ antiporter MnhG subunit
MTFLSWIVGGSAAILLVLATISFLRARDVFAMSHLVMITSFYIIPLLFLGVELEKFSLTSFAKIIAIILLNLVATNLLCYAITRRALINKIVPDAEIALIN